VHLSVYGTAFEFKKTVNIYHRIAVPAKAAKNKQETQQKFLERCIMDVKGHTEA